MLLILPAIMGGSIGSWIAMYVFRHKTKHRKFTIGIPVILLFQVYIVGSFSHAKIPEDVFKDIGVGDFAGEGTKGGEGSAEVFRKELC